MSNPSRRPRPGPRATATADADSTFLAAMARSLGIARVVFVPREGPAQPLWPTGPDDAPAQRRLLPVGREWLAAAAGPVAPSPGPMLAVAPVRAETGHEPRFVGVVLAEKTAGTWTDAERDLVRFTADFYGPSLDERAVRLLRGGRFPVVGRPDATSGPPDTVELSDDLETGMRSAAGNGELYLVYQPEVDLITGEVVAVEALLRWLHPQRGSLEPEAFIALAEKSDLIKLLGAWVITESTRQLAVWKTQVPGLDVMLRVNVSPVQVTNDDLVQLLADALAANRLPGTQLCIEITENVKPGDIEQLSHVLRKLKSLGITSAMDDVGAGYSSLSRLRHLPVDVIKIDRSLVTGLADDRRAQVIVASLVRLAGDLGMQVIAEGVEDEVEAHTLITLGCSRAQGHHFGRPMSHVSMESVLHDRGRIRTG